MKRDKVTFIELDEPSEITDESMFDAFFSLVGHATAFVVAAWLLEWMLP